LAEAIWKYEGELIRELGMLIKLYEFTQRIVSDKGYKPRKSQSEKVIKSIDTNVPTNPRDSQARRKVMFTQEENLSVDSFIELKERK